MNTNIKQLYIDMLTTRYTTKIAETITDADKKCVFIRSKYYHNDGKQLGQLYLYALSWTDNES